ncbi:CYTH domain-containing protein [Cellulosimicrobium arenosum]|uniref:CYTH domain-containing protein n=1 Tax=Cellulosimicrobium arenosum TaxID=2708133 RepID=A0A927J1A6_9MICO|nr:CYTH domain-containing protein [Cellulosimicrobium arenosum]MBD8080069.1 CYTH domain-containing protein [Cellulosimicrobium arenosum]
MTDGGYGDFEFERRFLVRSVPPDLRDAPTLIVQSYYLADEGYALRLRAKAPEVDAPMAPSTDALDTLAEHADAVDLCTLTVKGPTAGGTRYEAEREIDPAVGLQMIRRGGALIVKTRYSAWLGDDGWVIDVFGGANHPLVIAECERTGPVTDLRIPAFCLTELTDDARFSNDALAGRPFGGWRTAFDAELESTGPHFAQDFGRNQRL